MSHNHRFQVNGFIFTTLHALHAMRSSHEKAVRPSICETRALWQSGRSIQIFISYKTSFT